MADLTRGKRVLVQEHTERKIKLWQLSFEGSRAFEEIFHADGPEFLVIGGGIGIKYRHFFIGPGHLTSQSPGDIAFSTSIHPASV